MCKIFSLIPSKKLSPEKTDTKVFTSQLMNDKIYSYTKKTRLALGNLAKLVFWLIWSIKNIKVNSQFVSVFSSFFDGTTENIFILMCVGQIYYIFLSFPRTSFWIDWWSKKNRTVKIDERYWQYTVQSFQVVQNFRRPLRGSFCVVRRKSCDLSHVIYFKVTILIMVFSFPKLNDGQWNFFFCLSTTEA